MTTHYAHARYAAHETPDVRWFDPRDKREVVQFGGRGAETQLGSGRRRARYARVEPYQPVEFGEPAQYYVARISIITGETHGNERRAVRSEVKHGREQALAWLADQIGVFDSLPRRDAVAHRTGDETEVSP
jgi:hypothetical protein